MRHDDHRAAFERLIGGYLAPLRRLAGAYARDAADREDLFQEIALALWRALPGFRGDASERTWLYRVAHNTAIDFVTRGRRRQKHEQSGDLPDRQAAGATPEWSALDAERRERLWTAVRDLPMPDRQVVILHLEGLSAAEIEGVTGLTAGSIATRLTRVRHKLTAAVLGGSRP